MRKGGRKTAKHAGMPLVGIFCLVGNKLWIDSTPLDQAGRYADFLIHEGDHISYWAELVRAAAVRKAEYEEHPRGCAAYDAKTGKYTLLADRSILRRKGVVKAILR